MPSRGLLAWNVTVAAWRTLCKISIYLIPHNVILHMSYKWDSSTKIDYTYDAGQRDKITAITYVTESGARVRLKLGDTVEAVEIYPRAPTVRGRIIEIQQFGRQAMLDLDTGVRVTLQEIVYVGARSVPVAEEAPGHSVVGAAEAATVGGAKKAAPARLPDHVIESNALRKLEEQKEKEKKWEGNPRNGPYYPTTSDDDDDGDTSLRPGFRKWTFCNPTV